MLEETKTLIWPEFKEISKLLEWERIQIAFNDIWQGCQQDILFLKCYFSLENVVDQNIGCRCSHFLSLETSLKRISTVKSWNQFICSLEEPLFSNELVQIVVGLGFTECLDQARS